MIRDPHERAGRSVPEWRGKSPDSQIPTRVKLRVFERFGGVCQIRRRKIRAGERWDVDHIIALANGGENVEANLQPVLVEAHREKTRADVKIKSKIARQRAAHLGLKKPKTRGLSKPKGAVFDWSRGRYVRNP